MVTLPSVLSFVSSPPKQHDLYVIIIIILFQPSATSSTSLFCPAVHATSTFPTDSSSGSSVLPPNLKPGAVPNRRRTLSYRPLYRWPRRSRVQQFRSCPTRQAQSQRLPQICCQIRTRTRGRQLNTRVVVETGSRRLDRIVVMSTDGGVVIGREQDLTSGIRAIKEILEL